MPCSAPRRARSEAKESTKARNDAVQDLDRWMDDFLAIGQSAIGQQPRLREKLGLRARS